MGSNILLEDCFEIANKIKVGDKAPDFTLPDTDLKTGRHIKVISLGKAIWSAQWWLVECPLKFKSCLTL
jgi:hypothetical protein